MKIKVNGEDIDFKGTTVQDVIDSYKIKIDGIAVEKNGEIVHRETYSENFLADGDVIEIVRFVGGG